VHVGFNPLRVDSPQIKYFQKTEINQIENAWTMSVLSHQYVVSMYAGPSMYQPSVKRDVTNLHVSQFQNQFGIPVSQAESTKTEEVFVNNKKELCLQNRSNRFQKYLRV